MKAPSIFIRTLCMLICAMAINVLPAQLSQAAGSSETKKKQKSKMSKEEIDAQSTRITKEQARKAYKVQKGEGAATKARKQKSTRAEPSSEKRTANAATIRKATPEEIEAIRNGGAEKPADRTTQGRIEIATEKSINPEVRDALATETQQLRSQITAQRSHASDARKRLAVLAEAADNDLKTGTLSREDYDARMDIIRQAQVKVSELEMAIRSAENKLLE